MGVKVGLIGAGTMGRRHLQSLARDSRVELVGVADTVSQAAMTAAESVGARPCRNLAELVDLGIEAVFITLPNVFHGPVVLDALAHRLHVFSEKPMATTLEEGRQIRERVRRDKAIYQIGFNRRWAPAYRFLRQHIDTGFVSYSANVKINDGDMLTPSWYTNVKISGGFMYDTAVHLFDMVNWLVGPIERVTAAGRQSCYPDFDDIALLLHCAGDRPVAFSTCGHASWAPPQERVELYGDHASLVSEDLDRARHATRETPQAAWEHFPSPDQVTLWGYVDQDRTFIDACLHLAPPPVTVDDAFRSLAVLDAAYRSIAAGGTPMRVATE
jgi:myo-inositol 2-dehydrogenase/D-chiro-inositol 1-dehydrogenase